MKRPSPLGTLLTLSASGLALRQWLRRRKAIDFAGQKVVIVGGSRGLGLAIARELAAEGAHLVLVARNSSELERAQTDISGRGGIASVYVCDIRNRADVQRTISRIAEDYGGIDVLINDAGTIQVGPVEHATVADFEDAMATHFWGPLFTIFAALPHLARSQAKRIVNISSIGGRIAVPHLLPYGASKFALTGLSDGLHAELASQGICVTTVSPGLMRTGSTYNAWFKGQYRREFAWFHMVDSMPGLTVGARRAARQIVEACRYGDAALTIGLPARLASLMNASCPRTMARVMAVANRLLPSPSDWRGREGHSGWQSISRFVPSIVTSLSDRATIENNEEPGFVPGRPVS
jgi:NAD(P)-dependent dehydrogenase (short-subunit alcohol dehydrogenase family)